MAGYIGSKAVNLSTTGADINGDANIDGDLSFRDNDKIKLGAGSDLQIYHDGSNSYIDDAGTGNLTIRANQINFDKYTGEAMARFRADGNTELFYDNAAKLATTSTGIDVTGTVTADALNVSAASPNIDVTDTGTSHASQDFLTNSNAVRATIGVERSAGGGLFVGSSPYAAVFGTASAGNTEFATNNNVRMTISSVGDVGIGTSSVDRGKLHVNHYNSISAGVFNDAHLALTFNTSPSDNDGYAGITYATSDSDNYGWSVGARRTNSGVGDFVFTQHTNNATGTERMRIDSSGRVMIGTTTEGAANEAEELTIAGTGGVGMTIRSTNSGTSRIYFSDGTTGTPEYAGYQIYNHSSNAMIFGTNAIERMRIDSSGNLLVGKTSGVSDAYLQLGGSSSKQSLRMENSYGSGNDIVCLINNQTNATYQPFVFENGGTNRGSIQTTTSGTNYYTSSDHRMKENVVDLTGATARLKQLQPKRFNFIGDDSNPTVDGFLAHEAQAVVPEAVSGSHNEVDAEGNPVYQGIDQSKLVPLLTAALQEALDEITDLKARVATLEAN